MKAIHLFPGSRVKNEDWNHSGTNQKKLQLK